MKQITVSGAVILLTMHCILCSIVSGELKLLEHKAARWLTKDTLCSVDWLPADQMILDKIKEILHSGKE